MLAKAAFLTRTPSEAERLLEPVGATGLLVDAEGTVRPLAGMEAFLT